MKKIKLLATLLCGALAVGSFSGCGDNATTNKSEKVVNVWSFDAHSKTVMNELVTKYNQEVGTKKGFKLVYTVKDGDLNKIVDMSIASKQAPELFITNKIEQYAQSGDIVALEDLPGGKEYLATYDASLLKKYQYKDKTYKVPYYATTFGLIYNKDMFKKYGLVDEKGEAKPPKTYTELREYAKKLTNPEKQEYGIIIPMKWSGFFGTDVTNPAMRSCGTNGYDPVKGEYNYDGTKGILNMYLGLKEDKSFFPGSDGLDNDPARAQFAEGKIGMKFAASYDVGVFDTQFPAKMDFGVAPYPVENENEIYKQRMSSDGYMVINKTAVDNVGGETILEIYKWIHSNEVLTALYKEGKAIPYDWDIVKDIKLENPAKGWVDFCKMADISANNFVAPPIDITGQKDLPKIFFDEIWTGTITVDEAIADVNKRYNIGLQKKYNDDTTLDKNKFIDKSWNVKISN